MRRTGARGVGYHDAAGAGRGVSSPLASGPRPRSFPMMGGMRRLLRVLLVLSAALLAGCATRPGGAAPVVATVIVVRHAEKVDNSRDPELGAAGRTRAQALAARLDGVPLAAIYATEFQRTGQTVGPTAVAQRVAITPYGASQPAGEVAALLRADHPRDTVLVAGHSNTVPALVAALCACTAAPMADTEYDRLSIITFDANGRAQLDVQRYGAPSATP